MDRPYLILAPLKVELLNVNPKIYKFINVLSNNEIDTIRSLATSKVSVYIRIIILHTVFVNLITIKLRRAQTLGYVESDYRTAKM